jgi:hypothetical protein
MAPALFAAPRLRSDGLQVAFVGLTIFSCDGKQRRYDSDLDELIAN